MYKKNQRYELKIYLLIFLCFLCALFSGKHIKALDHNSQTPNIEKFVCKKILENDILCTETVQSYTEEKIQAQKQNTKYKKRIKMTKIFERKNKEGNFKEVANCICEIIFTYDKKSFVKIEDPLKDIKIDCSDKKWSVMSLAEIFPQEKMCLVSSTFVLYKENALGIKEHKSNTHFDITCSLDGILCINTNIR